jgi:hypothetical protein
VIHLQQNAQAKGIYAALVLGSGGELYVRIGGSEMDWEPYHSNYRDYREYAQGVGWKVWVKIPRNPEVQQASLKGSLPIPDYREPQSIHIPDAWLQ